MTNFFGQSTSWRVPGIRVNPKNCFWSKEDAYASFPCQLRGPNSIPGLTTFLVASLYQSGMAATLCVNPNGTNGCYLTISVVAVSHATAGSTIKVSPGTYQEDVVILIPLVLIGAGADSTIFHATGLGNGVFVGRFHHPGLSGVVVARFTVENAQFEGILVVSATKVTVGYNVAKNNDASPGLLFTGAPTGCPGSLPLKPTKQETAAGPFT